MKKLLITAAVAAIIGSSASAQSKTDEHNDSIVSTTRVLMLENGKVSVSRPIDPEVRDKILTFYYDQFRHSQDPGAPAFLFMSKEQNVMMGIGGTVRMRGWYDWGGAVPGNGFFPYLIPVVPDPTNDKKLGTTPAGTCLYFRVLGENKFLGHFEAYIEANFNGWQGRDFRLKKAYAVVRDFTVGYASSSFSDPAATPSTVDAAGPNNKLDHTTVLVRYMPRITKNILAAVSVETPDTYPSTDDVLTKTRSSYMPDFAAFLQYDWGVRNSQHIRLSALYRSLPYRDLVAGKNYNPAGWGIQLSSVSHPVDALTLYATASYGAGYAGMGGDLVIGRYDLLPDASVDGKMYAPRSFGWNVGVQYNIRHNLFVSVMGSQTRFLPSQEVSPDEYKYGLMGAVNVFWNPIPRVQLGAEFDLGERMNFSGAHRYARRFGLMGQLTF